MAGRGAQWSHEVPSAHEKERGDHAMGAVEQSFRSAHDGCRHPSRHRISRNIFPRRVPTTLAEDYRARGCV